MALFETFLIPDFIQAQAIGWGAERRFFSTGVGEERFEVVEAELALGGLDGGAGEEANHFVKKAIAGEDDTEAFECGLSASAEDAAVVIGLGRFVASKGGEGAEVVAADEKGEGVVEKIRIELAWKMPGTASEKWGQDGRGGKFVTIGFFDGIEASVEIGRDFIAGHDADGGGEFGIEGGNPVVGIHGELVGGVEMGDLAEGVDAGIGAARGVEADFFFGHKF